MSQQAPKLVSDTHYCVVGDVSIDESAVIASGVVLQAASGSRIIIGQGVCLAAGVCIQARKGVLTIAAGASLGANVLVVGRGEVGAAACVSAGATLINPAVVAEAILPPDALIETPTQSASQANGFNSNSFNSNGFSSNGLNSNGLNSNGFQPSSLQANSSYDYSSFQTQPSASSSSVQSSYQGKSYQYEGYRSEGYQSENSQSGSSQSGSSQSEGYSSSHTNGDRNGSSHGLSDSSSQMTVRTSYDRVYGREQVTRLISALFPNRQPPDR